MARAQLLCHAKREATCCHLLGRVDGQLIFVRWQTTAEVSTHLGKNRIVGLFIESILIFLIRQIWRIKSQNSRREAQLWLWVCY